jgi:uncharacterized membrane protein (GlpM family)
LFLAASLDVAIVLFFVVVGRAEHDESSGFTAIVRTAAPFLVGLVAGWLAARAWRRPAAVATALVVWPVTVLVGMIVRRWAFDEGTATSFVIVTTAFLGLCLVGWRLIARSVAGRPVSRGAAS